VDAVPGHPDCPVRAGTCVPIVQYAWVVVSTSSSSSSSSSSLLVVCMRDCACASAATPKQDEYCAQLCRAKLARESSCVLSPACLLVTVLSWHCFSLFRNACVFAYRSYFCFTVLEFSDCKNAEVGVGRYVLVVLVLVLMLAVTVVVGEVEEEWEGEGG
jgi:hypothetical protein